MFFFYDTIKLHGGNMSSKRKLIIVGGFLIFILIVSIIYLILPKIEMDIKGDKSIDLNLGEEYIDEGADAKLNTLFKTKKISVNTKNNIDNNKVGKYFVSYKASYKNLTKEMIRIVNVIDDKAPELVLLGEVQGCKGSKNINFKLKAYDDYDGDITKNVEYSVNNDEIIFNVSDSSNNETKLKQKINFMDKEKPEIILTGAEDIVLNVGDSYREYGAKAFDFCDGDITQKIQTNQKIDTTKPGIYEVEYKVTDSQNITTTTKRIINVIDNSLESEYKVVNGAKIYLTFDDGPGPYTEELLNILDEYGVKATFFVTGQFYDYYHLIGEEYKRGHTVGIHTYTHKWSIYQNDEDFLNDFALINNLIYEQTGEYSKIFRFPGGSSNTISSKYSKGIMSRLAKKLEEDGYIYYDWTFDLGDTNKKYNSVNAIVKNFKDNLKGDGEYIVLMHDIKKNTIKAIPEIIKFARANNYEFDKITEDTPIKHFKIAN